MKKIKMISALIMALFAVSMAVAAPVYADEDSHSYNCNTHFLGLKTWYDGLVDGNCNVMTPAQAFPSDNNEEALAVQKYVWKIVLNTVSMVLGVVGYLAIGLVIWGGIQYVTSQGDPGKAARGKKTVTNSVIGIVIVMTASIISGAVSDIVKQSYNGTTSFFLGIFNQAALWTGIITALMVVWGGIQYIISTGDPGKVTKAKNTIMYALIGLLIVIFAATIVNTVVGAVE